MLLLTLAQTKVYEFMLDYREENQMPPTVREIQDGLAIRNVNTVCGHLKALEKKKYIYRQLRKSRGIKFLRVA
jgi:SOS-response transcriptional repressor LexA